MFWLILSPPSFSKIPSSCCSVGSESCIWAYGSLMVSKSKSPPIAVHECCVFLWDDPAAVGRRLRNSHQCANFVHYVPITLASGLVRLQLQSKQSSPRTIRLADLAALVSTRRAALHPYHSRVRGLSSDPQRADGRKRNCQLLEHLICCPLSSRFGLSQITLITHTTKRSLGIDVLQPTVVLTQRHFHHGE
jgi:hypothetical protein